MNSDFPDRMYYKIGEVANMIGVKTSVLRFWETEFSFLAPQKSIKGQRLYSKKDVEMIHEVKRLLYMEKYTIEGVRKRFSRCGKTKQSEQQDTEILLKSIKNDLLSLRRQMR